MPLGPNRALHLVRAGREIVLLGTAEHTVSPIRRYSEAEAQALGLIDAADGHDRRRHPGEPRARPAAQGLPRDPALQDGGQVKTDGANAVQLLLFVGAISLVPALLFTVTGFTRILIVLSFIRTGLGTPTAPPNQVLVGIAFFLTLFVMSPTFKQIKHDAYDPLQKGTITQTVALKKAEAPLREFMFDQTRTKDIALFVKLSGTKNVDDAGRRPDHGPDPGVHHLRAQDGLPDRVPDLPAVPDHRPRRVLDLDVDGHDDAAPCLHLIAVQDPAVRPRRRLEPRHFVARSELPHVMSQDKVVSLIVDMMGVTMKVALPMLLVGLVVGLLISILQAVTQIQEQTLSFIPKILGLVAVVAIAGPWMLGTVVDWTTELWSQIPNYVGT